MDLIKKVMNFNQLVLNMRIAYCVVAIGAGKMIADRFGDAVSPSGIEDRGQAVGVGVIGKTNPIGAGGDIGIPSRVGDT